MARATAPAEPKKRLGCTQHQLGIIERSLDGSILAWGRAMEDPDVTASARAMTHVLVDETIEIRDHVRKLRQS